MNGVFPIKNTLEEVRKAVELAELSMREHIKKYYHNVPEEFITTLFYGHINYALQEASENRLIEKAFFRDLRKVVHYSPNLNQRDLDSEFRKQSKGLVADVVLHNKQQEGKTGGDFGLVVIHPEILKSPKSIEIKGGNSSGLLCQAKLRDKQGKWRNFTINQQKILPNYINFTSIVIYSYSNENRTELNPVGWKICKDFKFSEIEEGLKADTLTELISTSEVFMQLGLGKIGTQDQQLIKKVVSPSIRQNLEIRIHWKDTISPDDGRKINLTRFQHLKRDQQIRIKQRN
jgi:hypothetical protein